MEGVTFHNISLPGDRCVWIPVKNVSTVMSESVFREEFQLLDIHVNEDTQPRYGLRYKNHSMDPSHSPHFIVTAERRPGLSKVRARNELSACECRWNRTWLQNARCNERAPSVSDTCIETTDMQPGASLVGLTIYPMETS
jgi:hypothetical protein